MGRALQKEKTVRRIALRKGLRSIHSQHDVCSIYAPHDATSGARPCNVLIEISDVEGPERSTSAVLSMGPVCYIWRVNDGTSMRTGRCHLQHQYIDACATLEAV